MTSSVGSEYVPIVDVRLTEKGDDHDGQTPENRTPGCNDHRRCGDDPSRPDFLSGQIDNSKPNEPAKTNCTDVGYELATELDDLLMADLPIFGEFEGSVPVGADIPGGPSLGQVTRAALDHLDNDNGIFLLVEHEGMDTFGHAADELGTEISLTGVIRSVRELSAAVQEALDWADDRNDTLIIVTADHETGGLMANGNDSFFTFTANVDERTTSEHTNEPVPFFATGPNSERLEVIKPQSSF